MRKGMEVHTGQRGATRDVWHTQPPVIRPDMTHVAARVDPFTYTYTHTHTHPHRAARLPEDRRHARHSERLQQRAARTFDLDASHDAVVSETGEALGSRTLHHTQQPAVAWGRRREELHVLATCGEVLSFRM